MKRPNYTTILDTISISTIDADGNVQREANNLSHEDAVAAMAAQLQAMLDSEMEEAQSCLKS